MKNKYIQLIIIALLTAACGDESTSIVTIPGPKGDPAPSVDPPQTEVGDIIYYENKYRKSVGKVPLSKGLICTLYSVPNTTTQISGASLSNKGSFIYTENFNVSNQSTSVGFPILPSGLKTVYKTWFILRCSGQLVILEDGYHSFSVTSDDGSMLYIGGGSAVVSNDGLHGSNKVTGSKFLRRGVVTFRLDYFQGSGNETLSVDMDGSLLEDELLYK